jgi:hypothetical protein
MQSTDPRSLSRHANGWKTQTALEKIFGNQERSKHCTSSFGSTVLIEGNDRAGDDNTATKELISTFDKSAWPSDNKPAAPQPAQTVTQDDNA